MKRLYFIITFIITGTVLMPSCDKVLDVEPQDVVYREDMFKSAKDIMVLKAALYNGLQHLVEQQFVLGEARADLISPARGAVRNKDVMQMFNHNVTPDNKFCNWGKYYSLINHCNDIIELGPKLDEKDNSISTTLIYQIMGEAIWTRAWCYFQLVRNFGDVPLVLNTTKSFDENMQVKPTPQDQILDRLETDLLWAKDSVYINWEQFGKPTEWNRTTVNYGSMIALLGDIYLYRNKYEKAYSDECYGSILFDRKISPRGDPWSSYYKIGETDFGAGKEWFNIFFASANIGVRGSLKELILTLRFSGKYYQDNGLMRYTSNIAEESGEYIVKPSAYIMNAWQNNMDYNRGEGASYYIDKKNNNEAVIWKYIGMDALGNRREPYQSNANIHIYRTAGLLLKAAEAANRAGDVTGAIDIVNSCRIRVGLPRIPIDGTASMDEVEDYIIKEREYELAFEGERWYDLMRIARRRNDPNYLIDRVVKNVPEEKKAIVRNRLSDTKNWLLPYYADEVERNPALIQE